MEQMSTCITKALPHCTTQFFTREESVKMLLEKGAWLRPCHRNELHLLAESGADNILQLILEDSRCTPDIINRADEEGRTSVYIAARNGHKTCVKLLVSHGGDLAHIANNGHTVVDAIFDQFTKPVQFFLELLNESISMTVNERDDCIYHIDFDILSPRKRERQMDVISNLLVVSDEEKTELLQHPVIEIFLILKWKKICHLFYLWIIIYIIFAITLAVFVNLAILHNIQELGTLKLIIKYLLILSAGGLLGHAILQCLLTQRNYFRRYEMWMNLICTTLSLVTALMTDISSQSAKNTPNWVLHVTSIGVLLAWIELMLLIGRLPTFGYYALMFAAVLQNVVKVLFAFVCLVIGFALSFSIQFHDYQQFRDPWRAVVKTTVMMMGEFEYSDLFSDNKSSNSDFYRLPTTSRFIFLMFIILTSIVLMNLMIGLAVSDIQGLQQESHARKVEKQAEFLCQLEKVISSKQFNSKYVPVFIKKVFVKKSFIDNKYQVKCSAEFLRTEKLPRRLIDSIVAISKSRKQLHN